LLNAFGAEKAELKIKKAFTKAFLIFFVYDFFKNKIDMQLNCYIIPV